MKYSYYILVWCIYVKDANGIIEPFLDIIMNSWEMNEIKRTIPRSLFYSTSWTRIYTICMYVYTDASFSCQLMSLTNGMKKLVHHHPVVRKKINSNTGNVKYMHSHYLLFVLKSFYNFLKKKRRKSVFTLHAVIATKQHNKIQVQLH